MADTLSTRDINTAESVGSLDSEDKILMSDGGAALKSVPRNTLAKDVLEEYEDSIMGGEKQSVKHAMDSLMSRMDSLEISHVPEGAIETAVENAMQEFLDDGTLVNLVIEDGSITRQKVNSAFEATLAKADSAMQPSVYDPNGYGTHPVSPTDPYSYGAAQAQKVKNEIQNTDTYAIIDDAVTNTQSNHTGVANAISGALNRAERYTNAMISNYQPFQITFVETLPETGADRTFYLIPNENGQGYHKWWYITGAAGTKTWDGFGSSSTLVVTSLPQVGDDDVDYILDDNGDYQYYKWIDSSWKMIAGSNSEVITVSYAFDYKGVGTPDNADISTDISNLNKYYLDIEKLWVYRAAQSGSAVTWNYLTALVAHPSESKDYFVMDTTQIFNHFRYNGTRFYMVGSDTFSKEELEEWINPLETQISTMQGDIDTIDAKVDSLGNMVSDITETSSGISVHYKDGSSKGVSTKDLTIKVEDLDALDQNRGVKVTYTDGSTKDIEISGGGGGGTYSGAASITRVTNASIQCVYGDTCNIEYIFSATDSAGDTVGSGTATWYVNNVKKATSTAYQVVNNTFNIGPYLNVGGNTIKLSISVDTGGDTPTVTTKTWTVNAVNLYLTWDYDDTTINTADNITLRWTPYGDLSKTTHIIVDGVERTDLQSVTTRSGVQQYVTMTKLTHGSHLVQMYLTATINSQTIQSATVTHDMMFIDPSSNVPVISCSVGTGSITQYNTLSIPVAVYNPSALTSTLILAENGTTVATWTDVDRSLHYWNYTPSTAGTKTLTLTCGSITKTITLNVVALDIDNEEVSGYQFRLKASDIAGNDALRNWSSNGITATFSNNFDWNNGGIKTEVDSSGNIRQYICVKAGTTMTIGYQLFGNDAKINGKNFKVVFKTNNCRDYDAVWLDCMSDGIGIQLGANNGTASSEQNTISVSYAEGSIIEFEYDIYPDNLVSTAGNAMRYIQTYIDGVLSSNKIYASNDNFTQTTKENIVIGSQDCDVYVYMVKAYETYITRENHIANFIADAPNAVEMVSRYNRNDVLAQNGEIDYTKLATQNPNCRVHLWDIPRMTQNKIKKDPVSGCSYQQIYMAGTEADQISAEGVTIGVQGTSSINYISSAANTDGRFDNGFTDGNGNHIDGYSMTAGAIPVNYFNTKVNVASCENINNMCIAGWYNDHQPYLTRSVQAGGRDCMEHHIGVQFIRDRHEDNEPASAALFTDVDPDGDNYHMYAICNMGNSKDNGTVFHDATNPLECCVETKDNNSAICMMTSELTLEALETEDYFEFRYPKNPTSAMKTAFINFVNWFCSRNPAAATGNALPEAVTYEPYTFKGTSEWDTVEQPNEVLRGLTISDYAGTYTRDTYEYRMARLLDECEDHLVMDSMVYHYVFVEQHAMVDNVCKNVFWGTDDLIHWHVAKNYDNDTADGNNNTGKLTIPFGAEGMDTISGGDVFNGKMNVYWQFIYGLYPARRLMWQNREAAGTWNADAYLEYATGQQNFIPERVYNQDYWYKYLRPYEQNGDTTYIDMLEGGKKNHQREGFVRNNLTYMASQYTGTYCTSDSITVRAYTPGVSADMTAEEAAIINATIAAVPPSPTIQVMLYNKGYVVVEVASVMKRVKAEKGVWKTIDFSDSSSAMNDTVVNIHGASNVRAIGDMSPLYIKFSNFSKAVKLRSLQIGSNVTGYTNLGLESVGFESNPMLEELYIQNCPNANTTLDLSGCQALRTLDVRGSGFTGINFAVGGLLETAYLCSPASLSMRSLYYVSDNTLSLESYNNLTTLRFEDVPNVDSLNLVNVSTSLARARILDVNWSIATTDILNRLLSLMGLDESDHNTETSVVSGYVYVSGQIRNHELETYEEAWPNLEVDYNGDNLVTQYKVTYVNDDDEHTILWEQFLDQGSLPIDPVSMNLIETPNKNPTEQYTYTFSGWDNITTTILGPRTITAVYTPVLRTYTVRWYARAGVLLKVITGVEYGSECVYEDETHTIPTWTDGESSNIYRLFAGWNLSTGYITGDTDVYAVWQSCNVFPSTGTPMNNMTVAEIYGVCKAGVQGNYFEDLDYTDITLGQDFDFTNVESITIGEDITLDGIQRDQFVSGGYYFDGENAFTTDIVLFDEDSPAFTMAIDFQFNASTSGETLVSTHEGATAEGFRLYWNGSRPTLQFGDQTLFVGQGKLRDIVVFRHPANSRYLYVYTTGGDNTNTRFASSVTKNVLLRSNATQTEEPLTFGAVRFANGFRNYGKGTIHWCKIWKADLGEDVAYKLAYFPHEKLRMEYWGAGKYYYANSNVPCGASFVANNLLGEVNGRGMWFNTTSTNVGGWDGSLLRTFLNDIIYHALPQAWQSAIQEVEINTTSGNKSTEIIASSDKIYLPSYREMGSGNTSAGYIEEVGTSIDPISWFTSNPRRLKFKGKIRGYDPNATIYTGNSEPAALNQTDIAPGSIWVHTGNSNNGYIFITKGELDQYGITPNIVADDNYAQGGWVMASNWWLRSPYLGYATDFWFVSTYGGLGSFSANYVFGVAVSFSI